MGAMYPNYSTTTIKRVDAKVREKLSARGIPKAKHERVIDFVSTYLVQLREDRIRSNVKDEVTWDDFEHAVGRWEATRTA